MKLSIITTCLNSERTIRFTLNSILSQSYKNIEHIIIDAGSTDGTKKILKKYNHRQKKIFTLKNSSIYQAINFGIKKSTGDYIAILNSDDIYNSNTIIEKVVKIIKKKKFDLYLGDVVFVDKNEFLDPLRFYSAKGYEREMIKKALMPPHPATFVSKRVYERYFLYNENLKIASDFDFFLNTLMKLKLNFFCLNEIIVRMRLGGISTKNFYSFLINSYEIYKSFKINNMSVPYFYIILRLIPKFKQLIYFSKKIINHKFELPKFNFEKEYFYSREIKIVKDLKNIINKNFVLSGLNLSFLGSYAENKVKIYKELYHWPDGSFAYYSYKLKKIAGRDLLKNIKLPKIIQKIVVVGNLTDKSKKYLFSKFKLPIVHIDLPYGDVNKIIQSLKVINLKNKLTFITLPTPKQEIVAEHLSKINKFYKIICIGGSIAMASGDERPVPKLLYKFEFLWRLQFETKRRIKRLTATFYYFLKERFTNNKFKENYIRIVN